MAVNYWWVSQKQTYRHEVPGGYMWSPKKQTNGERNHSYDLMTLVKPGDIVFSFANAQIKAIGIVQTYCYEFPKPIEFGNSGSYWNDIGWRIDVSFKELRIPFRPKNHVNEINPLLAATHAPIQRNGNGNQAYLFKIGEPLAHLLAKLAGDEAQLIMHGSNQIAEHAPQYVVDYRHEEWENRIVQDINNSSIEATTKQTIIEARLGQGKFRQAVSQIEKCCRVTKVDKFEHLIASHIKPWRDGSDEERLDPENGLMLTPSIDHLFDKGFITFDRLGQIRIAKAADKQSLFKMGIPEDDSFTVGRFSQKQNEYLDFHRDSIFLRGNT